MDYMKTHTLLVLFPTALVVAFGLAACKPPAPSTSIDVVRPVKTITVGAAASSPSGASFSAEIKPRIESQLAFRVGGKVVSRLVEIGQIVRQDQPLMRLDLSDLQLSSNAAQAQVAVAKANADVAEAALKRSQELAKQNFISAGALDQVLGQANSAKAALLAAQANGALGLNATAYGELKADGDGVVTALTAEVGQIVAAGTPVIRVAVGREKDAVFNIPERLLGAVKRGSVVSVQLWSQPGLPLLATVRDVAAMADPLTRTYIVKASLKDATGAVPLGTTATVTLSGSGSGYSPVPAVALDAASRSSLSIPLSAIVESQGKTAVWVVQSGVVKKQMVTLNASLDAGSPASADSQVTVLTGLAPGAVVVIAGVHVLSEGQKVKLMVEATKP